MVLTDSKNRFLSSVVVIGGGPAGLMSAEVISNAGLRVDLFEGMPSAGRKLLIAGKGGLNLTHSEPFENFLDRYGSRRVVLEPILRQFGPAELVNWVNKLGFETYTGSSGRIFPKKLQGSPGKPAMGPAAAILKAWLNRLDLSGVTFHFRHRWLGWDQEGCVQFDTPQGIRSFDTKAVILALGGGSWKQTGSNGEWVSVLRQRGVFVKELRPANCGFNVGWSEHFRNRFRQPLRPVRLIFTTSNGESFDRLGDLLVTEYGLEGSLIYAASALLRDEIEKQGKVTIQLDLAPGWSEERLRSNLSRPRGSRTIASHLERAVGLRGVRTGLLRECLSKEGFSDPFSLARAIKALPVTLQSTRPLEEAISSAGGVAFECLDDRLMVRNLPGVFCAGEMLDWEAPTGGYLLTACISSGRAAGLGALKWLTSQASNQD